MLLISVRDRSSCFAVGMALMGLALAARSVQAQPDPDKFARVIFNLLDKNKNSIVDPEEWATNTRLRDFAVSQGEKLDQPYNFDKFKAVQAQYMVKLKGGTPTPAGGAAATPATSPPSGTASPVPATTIPSATPAPVGTAPSTTNPTVADPVGATPTIASSVPAAVPATVPAAPTIRYARVRLPDVLVPVDKDRDGQIGLYEWLPRKVPEFITLDRNADGFLTPRELAGKSIAADGVTTTWAPIGSEEPIASFSPFDAAEASPQ